MPRASTSGMLPQYLLSVFGVLERDDFSSNPHPALAFFSWSMILSENRRPLSGITLLLEHDLFRKPVSTFRDHGLGSAHRGEEFIDLDLEAIALARKRLGGCQHLP